MNKKIYLVGSGPGNIDLLTIRASNIIKSADFILYDQVVSQEILELAKHDCEKVSAGLKGFDNPEWQEKLAALCAEKAAQGLRVCRLKSGDPFIFGNGAETVEFLSKLGCDVEVVPGISSGISAAISRGIPLTHTQIPAVLCLASGHESKQSDPPDWKSLAGCGTIIIYMGVARISHIARELMRGGMSPETSACFVERATQTTERLVSGQLGNIADIARENDVKEPAVCIIGRMAGNFSALNFEHVGHVDADGDPALQQPGTS